ncbi:MAG: glycoside hydrolase family 3 protein [Brevinematia bacterium]
MNKNFFFFVLFSCISTLFSLEGVDQRVNSLLKKMSLEEKIGQMILVEEEYIASNINDILKYKVGGIYFGENSFPTPNTPEKWVDLISKYQSQAYKTSHKIPLFVAANIYHGNNKALNSVIFPHNIGVGATFEPELAKRIGEITAKETLPLGINLAFLPSLSVPKDLRWGQVYEAYSEDARMVGDFISAFLFGLQGKDISKRYALLGCVRGFAGEGAIKKGLYNGNIEITEDEMKNIHLYPFQKAIEANAKVIMLSYSSWNGKEIHSDSYLVNEILRKELKFDGIVFSEKNAFYELQGDYETQLKTAINTGIDVFLVSSEYKRFFETLKSLIRKGEISEKRIDESVKRILKIKLEYKIFEKANTSIYHRDIDSIGSKKHREIAKEIVRKSLVLLKNNGILPITNNYKRILVTGKNASDVGNQCGGWTIYKYGSWQRWLHQTNGLITSGKTIFHSLKEHFKNSEVVYEKEPKSLKYKEYDIAIAVIGERPYAEKGGYRRMLTLDYEDFLNPDIYVLDYRDTRVIRKVVEAKIPLVIIFVAGRPLMVKDIIKKSDAFLMAWLPGTEGDGVVDVITGKYSPTGRLPVRWPANMWQIPFDYKRKQKPLFPLGFGLSY